MQHALLHVATRTGVRADLTIVRSGYVPRGGGVVRLVLTPPTGGLRALRHEGAGHVVRFWGTSLASHLAERRVAARMAAGARAVLAEAGYDARIDEADDESAAQPGAALARGRSAVRIPGVTEHVESGLRLAREFLGVDARIADDVLMLTGWKADDEQL